MHFNVFRKRREAKDFTSLSSSTPSRVSLDSHLEKLKLFEQAHKLDPNFAIENLTDIDAAIATGNVEKGIEIENALMEDTSPYAEVRAVVRNYDVDLPVNTIRAWVIGLVLCTVGSGINMLFSLRNPNITFSTYVVQLVAYPMGLGWDLIMPDREWNVFGLRFNLRPGKFNFKEHVIIAAMSNAAYGGGVLYATDVLVAQKLFYGQDFGWAFQLLLAVSTLCAGYGLAGLVRRFLVWPASMIWPADLVNCALFYSLHDHSHSDPTKTNGWSIGRYKLFLIICFGSFIWYWFPGFLFQGLTYFAWICWVAPNNVTVQKLFGAVKGYGLMPISFDWAVYSGFIGSPLIPPFHAVANITGGIVFVFVIVSMGVHFTGTWYADYLPVHSSDSFDNTGKVYDVKRILDDQNRLNETAYYEYSPIFLATQFALQYAISFASMSAVLVHVVLYYGRDLWSQMKLARHQEDDVHMRLMKKYRDAEDWWYLALFLITLAMGFAVITGWDTGFSVWAYVICLLLPIIWIVPFGIVQAITNVQLALNVVSEYIVGYLLPGRPLAMMLFKNYGYVTVSQALFFTQDLKLGHYMKVPPRTMFGVQLIGSIWSAIMQICIMNWAFSNIPDLCNEDQPNGYSCPGGRVYFTASVIWGVIGPRRIFSDGAIYSSLQWFWGIGAILPIITWFMARRWPRSIWRYVSIPVILGGTCMLPPANVYIYLCWGSVGFIFYYIKRRFSGWWLQYNHVTSAGLDCGLVLSSLVIFLTLSLTHHRGPNWWGNNGALNFMDADGLAVAKTLAPGETFGPSQWA